MLNIPLRNSFCKLVLLLFCVSTYAQNAYIPDVSNPFKDKLRWARQEITNNRRTVSITTALDDSIWVLYENGFLHHYNGRENKAYQIKYEGKNCRADSIFIASDHHVYASTTVGVLSLQGEKWELVTNEISTGLNIRPIHQFSDGTIWYSHQRGLSKINALHSKTIIQTEQDVLSLCEVDNQNVWILADGGKTLYQAKRSNGTIEEKKNWNIIDSYPENPLRGGTVFKDSKNKVWVANSDIETGVHCYNTLTREAEYFDLFQLGGDNYNNEIIETNDGKIWITGRSFLHVYDGIKWKIHDQSDDVPSSYRMVIDSDSKGFFYLVDGGYALYRIDLSGKYWNRYKGLHFQDQSTSGERWYLSYEGNVILEKNSGDYIEFKTTDQIIQSALGLKVLANGDVVCFGSENGYAALSIWDHHKWKKHIYQDFSDSFGRDSFYELEDGSFLLGSRKNDSTVSRPSSEGILHFTPRENIYKTQLFMPEKAPKKAINICQTNDGLFWTNHFGIESFSKTEPRKSHRLPEWYHNWVEEISVTKDNTVWLSLWGMGIYSYNLKNGWKQYGFNKGLDTNATNRLITLTDDTLLTSTANGLYRYDHQNWFPFLDRSISMQRDAGNLVQNNRKVWINKTDSAWYKRWQKRSSYNPGNKDSFYSLCYNMDDEAPDTVLKYDHDKWLKSDNTTIEWTGLDSWSKTPKERLTFSYRINKGKWSEYTAQTNVSVDHLKGGINSFEVRARDEDLNVDPTPASINIIVSLPIWRQIWFYVMVVTLILAMVTVAIIFARLKIKHLRELEKIRSRFFLNLSHELRTPLSLLTIPIERLKKLDFGTKINRDLSLMDLNVKRLVTLVDQLLDFRKIEKGKLKTHREETDVITLLKTHIEVFRFQAEEKNIPIFFSSKIQRLIVHIDQDLFQKITGNLISNAIKYTPQNGNVAVNLDLPEHIENPNFQITIEDSGSGIPIEMQKLIFEPFYRGELNNLSTQGYGIGLALVKELLDALGGSIDVCSPINPDNSKNKGTKFIIKIPVTEIIDVRYGDLIEEPQPENQPFCEKEESKEDKKSEKSTILIIEDNLELRSSIASELSSNYHILQASTGREGIDNAKKHLPDIIISDVMMPEMDGFTMTETLKKDLTTSYIPILLLTALKSTEHQRIGLKTGADDYISKPISMDVLNLKIQNLLKTQRHLTEHIRNKYQVSNINTPLESSYSEFMDKTNKIINANIDNPEFDVDLLAKNMGMSRSGYYRKFQIVAGEQPATYIRSQRMKHAAELILSSNLNMTEVALSVGYTEAANFSRSFKQHFDCPPSKYKKTKT